MFALATLALADHDGPINMASLSHIHYWYEVGMLKVPAVFIACSRSQLYFWKKTRAAHNVQCSFYWNKLGDAQKVSF